MTFRSRDREMTTIALALVACGSVVAVASCGAADSVAPTPDGAADAEGLAERGAADSATLEAPVTVTVSNAGRAAAGVEVLFHDAEGTIVLEAKTDKAGRARSGSPAPRFVTVLTRTRPVTFAGTAPGDSLAVTGDDPLEAQPLGGVVGRYRVTLPGEVAGVTSYGLQIGTCYQSTPSGSPDVVVEGRKGCTDTASAVLAGAGTPSTTPVFAWKTGLVPKGETVVPVTLGPWTAATETTLTVKTDKLAPGTIPRASLLGVLPDDERFLLGTYEASRPAVFLPTGFPAIYQTIFQVEDASRSRFFMVRAAAAGPFAIDPAELLPCATAPKITTSTNGRFYASWSYAGPAPRSAIVLGALLASPTAPLGAWVILAPPDASRLRLPELPAQYGTPSRLGLIAMLDADGVDYDAARVVPTTTGGLGAFELRRSLAVGGRVRGSVCYVE